LHIVLNSPSPTAEAEHQASADIDVAGLFLVYGQGLDTQRVLDNVSLNVKPGSFISLIGPSGCGKTSLLRIVADLLAPSRGQVLVAGMPARKARLSNAYGYVFQTPALLPWRTSVDNIRLPMQVMGWPAERQKQRAEDTLRIVGLADFAQLYPWQLSGGMQQRVSIARALSFAPSLLLMDEPFGALDEITREGLNLHLHELWARGGLTVVFVTHSIPEAVFLSSSIAVMASRPGRIVEVIESNLPEKRTLEIREAPEFHALTARVRHALGRGHE
jgi:NitT/TauT family transport system ATP-binding protein